MSPRSRPAVPRGPFAYRGFFAKARDQLLLAVLQVIQVVDVAPLGAHLRAQPPKLLLVAAVVFAHATRGR
jgi:hypothetical protein